MITLRPAHERGHADHGWLDSWHSFSFADYRDDHHVHWGPLRVINEDRVAAGRGFGKHGHRDMEIISYVLEGALAHEDSMGTRKAIVPVAWPKCAEGLESPKWFHCTTTSVWSGSMV